MNIKNVIIDMLDNPLCVVEKYKHNGIEKYRIYIKLPRGGDVMKPTIQDVLNKLDFVHTNLSGRIDNLEVKVDNLEVKVDKNSDMIQKNSDMIENLIVKNDLKV